MVEQHQDTVPQIGKNITNYFPDRRRTALSEAVFDRQRDCTSPAKGERSHGARIPDIVSGFATMDRRDRGEVAANIPQRVRWARLGPAGGEERASRNLVGP